MWASRRRVSGCEKIAGSGLRSSEVGVKRHSSRRCLRSSGAHKRLNEPLSGERPTARFFIDVDVAPTTLFDIAPALSPAMRKRVKVDAREYLTSSLWLRRSAVLSAYAGPTADKRHRSNKNQRDLSSAQSTNRPNTERTQKLRLVDHNQRMK